ncbi:amidophosphoribosyltransferase [Candidatus Fermentibacterales bacterium]|nr:amidophosphoribosyltransferase [Candidatus Fermentibacterales bacterium]
MGGFFGIAGRPGEDCTTDLFYGTDYHSHLGTMRGGLAASNGKQLRRYIHDITNAQFRSKLGPDLPQLSGHCGIGVISDLDDQPLLIGSHLGTFAVVTVGRISNIDEIVAQALGQRRAHFSEMSGGMINPTELVGMIISREESFLEGIRRVLESVEGSCSLLVLTTQGIYAARDRLGRTPVILGTREDATAAALETSAFPNLGFETSHCLGPGEVVLLHHDGFETISPPGESMSICAFLWVYYGFPASHYEGINVEDARNRSGAFLARRDSVRADMVAGIPDSGTGHALGYATESGLPYRRPFVKYTPTWPRSFMPQDQGVRELVARMKLIPIPELIRGRKLLFCEDSIVRGTQLRDTIRRVFESGAAEVHMRPACPPLLHGCPFLNFSRSSSELDLAGRRAVSRLEGSAIEVPPAYRDPDSDGFRALVEEVRKELGLTSLMYQRLDDLISAIGMPEEKLCTYCWTGRSGPA